jgi:hypothetical protein
MEETIRETGENTLKKLWANAFFTHHNRVFGLASNNKRDLMSALELYQQIIDQFPDTNEANKAEKEISTIYCQYPDLRGFSKAQKSASMNSEGSQAEELYKKAYNYHYNYPNIDLAKAVALYQVIIESYPASEQAAQSRLQLKGVEALGINVFEVVNADVIEAEEKIKNAFKTLKISEGTTVVEVEKQFQKLAEIWNPEQFEDDPDKYFTAQEKQREYKIAYEVIKAHLIQNNEPKKLLSVASSKHITAGIENDDESPQIGYSLFVGAVAGAIGGCLGTLYLVLSWPHLVGSFILFGTLFPVRLFIKGKPGASMGLGVLGLVLGLIPGICLGYWVVVTFKLLP